MKNPVFRKTVGGFFKYFILIGVSLLILVPTWDMIVNSFKTRDEAAIPNIKLPTEWQIGENYKRVIDKAKIPQSFTNSLIVTFFSVSLTLIVSTLAAYTFGRRKEKGIRFLFYIFMFGIITPPSMVITVMMLKKIGLLGTRVGIILFYVAQYSPLPIFLITGFMATIPAEIEESAIMDGVRPLTLFTRIILPLLRPVIATSFIYITLKVWNDFLPPIYILAGNTKKYTMILSVYFFKGQFYTQWNLVFAFLTIVSIPVIIAFIIAQKQISEGLTAGAVKG